MGVTFRIIRMRELIQIGIFLSFGLAMLTPWNSWIESSDWFKLKLSDTMFAQSYAGYVSVVYQVFNILGLIFFLKYSFISPHLRIIAGFLMVSLVFVGSIVILYLPVSSTAYFYFVLSLVGFSAFAVASLSAIIGLAGSFPPVCMSFLYSGQGIAGILPLIIQILSQLGGQMNERSVAINSTICLIITICGSIGYFYLTKSTNNVPTEDGNPILVESGSEDLEQNDSIIEDDTLGQISEYSDNILETFKVIIYPCSSIFINLGVTLSLFPYVTAQVASVSKMSNFVLVHFFIFNIFDFIGKTCTVIQAFNIGNSRLVFYLSLSRLLFIPMIMACNLEFYHSGYSRWFPLVFHDVAYFLILATFAFTNGLILLIKVGFRP